MNGVIRVVFFPSFAVRQQKQKFQGSGASCRRDTMPIFGIENMNLSQWQACEDALRRGQPPDLPRDPAACLPQICDFAGGLHYVRRHLDDFTISMGLDSGCVPRTTLILTNLMNRFES